MKTRYPTLLAIGLGGLIAGTIDIGAAALISGRPLDAILRTIAGGLLGRSAATGGFGADVLGLVLQWAMGLIIAAIFVVAATRIRVLRTQWIGAGLAYGVAVFVVMNFVVLPLSAYHIVPKLTPNSLLDEDAMLLFGLIVSFFARRVGEPAGTAAP